MPRLHVVLAFLSVLHCEAELFHLPKIKFTRRGAGKVAESNTTQVCTSCHARVTFVSSLALEEYRSTLNLEAIHSF